MPHPDVFGRVAAIEHAIELLTLGHNSVFIRKDDDEDDFDVYPSGRELAPDNVGWTYADGTDIPEAATDHSRLMEPNESLDTLAQFRYHMPALEEWISGSTSADLSLEWSPVEDEDFHYCDECDAYHNADGDTFADNFAGHVYLMRIWE